MPGSGAVYVFARAGTTWSQQAYLKASNTGGPDIGYQFGFAVSLSSDGSTLAVSETSDPSNATGINGNAKDTSAPEAGAVFIFTHSGGTWSQQAYVKPWNTTTPNLLFGYCRFERQRRHPRRGRAVLKLGGRVRLHAQQRDWSQQMRVLATKAR
jgi:hypothetical protein